MAINQRDVYLLPFPLSTASAVNDHLHIVPSVIDANQNESTFIGVMITSSDVFYDEFSFDLHDHMFDHPLQKSGSHVRMHLMTLVMNKEIIGSSAPKNRMKKRYFEELMKQIGEMVLNFDFTPLN